MKIYPQLVFLLASAVLMANLAADDDVTTSDDAVEDTAVEGVSVSLSDVAPDAIETDGNDDGWSVNTAVDAVIRPVSMIMQDTGPAPLVPEAQAFQSTATQTGQSQDLISSVFGALGSSRSLLSEARRNRANQPGTDVVLGREGGLRAATDAGNLLGKSNSARGIVIEQRNPIVTDTKVRGSSVGELIASGSYWFPVRQDLDTALSKLDSRLIEDMIVIKGPYSALYGPGFVFIDIEFIHSPRYECGYETHGSTSLEYKTNGQAWFGRQSLWGGAQDWGFHFSYGNRTGSDYDSGNGTQIPSSYKSQDFSLALGYDLSDTQSLEFNYLRVDQADVEIAGQIFDIDSLVTDSFELIYDRDLNCCGDQFVAEAWYNQSRLSGNAQGAGKRRQIPILDAADFVGNTTAKNSSTGLSLQLDLGQEDTIKRTVGADVRYLTQVLDEIDSDNGFFGIGPVPTNFPLPKAFSLNPGIFGEVDVLMTDCWSLRGGGRVDWVFTDAEDFVPDAFIPNVSDVLGTTEGSNLDQTFQLWSLFLTTDYAATEHVTFSGGVGYGMRPPTMFEMYAMQPFMAALPQFAFTSPLGNPNLDAEKRLQFDLGVTVDYSSFRGGGNFYYAYIQDYIALDSLVPIPGNFAYTYSNSPEAMLYGFEGFAEVDLASCLTAFGNFTYTEGRDLSRDANGYYSRDLNFAGGPYPGTPRSTLPDPFPLAPAFSGATLAQGNVESLPAIFPFYSRVGLRLHDPSAARKWGLEFAAQIVDNQDRFAVSLQEQPTPGYTIYDLRGYLRPREHITLVGGVENLTDKNYLTHLDSRIISNPVFQPGINFYFSTEVTY